MARKVSSGLTGSPSIGALNVAPTAVITTADNQDITLSPTGTGMLMLTANAQLQGQSDLRFADSDSSNWVAFQAPSTVSANVTWTLPAADGSSDQVLTTNASGTLSWSSKSVAITDQTVSATIHYPLFTTSTSGTATGASVSTTKMTFQPSTGTLTTTALSTGTLTETSSIVFKENINPIENALALIMQLAGVTYDRKDNKEHEAGLIAEEVYKHAPDLVTLDENGNPYGIKYTKIGAYLIEAIKSLKQEIDQLARIK
jgi:hypothetical protein